jgi:hypothetical protein
VGGLNCHFTGGAVSSYDRVQGVAMAVGGQAVKGPRHEGARGLRATCPSPH